jgi:hypothetical protein
MEALLADGKAMTVSAITFKGWVGNMNKRRWLGLAIALMGAVLVICLPVILPVIAILQALYYWRMRAAAGKFTCLSCGSYLGSEAIRLADEAWTQFLSGKGANNPGVRFLRRKPRTVRHLRAICPLCGARYDFAERERTFIALRNDVW